MTAQIIDGKAFAAGLRERVGGLAAAFEAQAGRKAGLAVVLVGDDAASAVYVRSKGKATLAAGMASFTHILPAERARGSGRPLERGSRSGRHPGAVPATPASQ
jgi:methylenetetrahydrofolate dehydrogenase (NADP+)/methenyltetrahydrofolate cyclohydrolase